MRLVLEKRHIDEKTGMIKEEFLADGFGDNGELLYRIEALDLSGCDWLIKTSGLVSQLESLESKELGMGEFDLKWPRQFGRNDSIDAVKKKMIEDKNYFSGSPDTTRIFTEFLDGYTRKLPKSSDEVVKTIDELLVFSKNNPEHLNWIEEMSTYHVAGCVDEMALGIFTISAWVAVAKIPDIVDKIDKSRELMVMLDARSFVKDKKGDDGFTKEAVHLLLREVNNRLPDGKKFTGILSGVLNEVEVRKEWNSLPNDIDGFYWQKVSPTMKMAHSKIVENFLLKDSRIVTWGRVAFPDAVRNIEEKYEGVKNRLQELSSNEDPIEDSLLPKTQDGSDKNQPQDRNHFLQNKFDSMDVDRKKEIAHKTVELTRGILANESSPSSICGSVLEKGAQSLVALSRVVCRN
jgi:hypothetical protein